MRPLESRVPSDAEEFHSQGCGERKYIIPCAIFRL